MDQTQPRNILGSTIFQVNKTAKIIVTNTSNEIMVNNALNTLNNRNFKTLRFKIPEGKNESRKYQKAGLA